MTFKQYYLAGEEEFSALDEYIEMWKALIDENPTDYGDLTLEEYLGFDHWDHQEYEKGKAQLKIYLDEQKEQAR